MQRRRSDPPIDTPGARGGRRVREAGARAQTQSSPRPDQETHRSVRRTKALRHAFRGASRHRQDATAQAQACERAPTEPCLRGFIPQRRRAPEPSGSNLVSADGVSRPQRREIQARLGALNPTTYQENETTRLRVRGVPLAGEALATWGLRPAQFQSKCRRRYQVGCCRAQGQDPRPWQHPRRRQIDVFGDQSSRFSDSVLHPPQHCRCRPRSYQLAGRGFNAGYGSSGCAAFHSLRRPRQLLFRLRGSRAAYCDRVYRAVSRYAPNDLNG